MDVLKVCPFLIARNRHQTIYHGQLSVCGKQFEVALKLQKPGQIKGAQIDFEWSLAQLLTAYKPIIQQRINSCSSLPEFLVELQSIIESQLVGRGKNIAPDDRPAHYYDVIIQQLEQLGWHRVLYIDSDFHKLHLSVKDARLQEHILKVKFPLEFPAKAPVCLAELPDPFDVKWTSKSTLLDLVSQLEASLRLYEDFWLVMEDLDAHTWILEPEKPNYAAKYRRIALGQSASVHVEMDPHHPRLLPRCQFLGADHVTAPLRENYNSNILKWDESRLLRTNLELLLEVTFPSRHATQKEEMHQECGICYAYRLEEELPDQVCDDSRCAQPYHHTCLYQWLRAIPDSRQSFNLLFGECPYCNKPITVKIPLQ